MSILSLSSLKQHAINFHLLNKREIEDFKTLVQGLENPQDEINLRSRSRAAYSYYVGRVEILERIKNWLLESPLVIEVCEQCKIEDPLKAEGLKILLEAYYGSSEKFIEALASHNGSQGLLLLYLHYQQTRHKISPEILADYLMRKHDIQDSTVREFLIQFIQLVRKADYDEELFYPFVDHAYEMGEAVEGATRDFVDNYK